MLSTIVTRQLIGLEDLLTGEGIVSQVRAGSAQDITKINAANFPYSEGVTLDSKLTEILNIAQSLSVVDDEGNFLTGYINTSDDALDLEDRLWRRTPDASTAEIYYDDVLILQYNRVTGGLILPSGTDYIAADATVVADQLVITNAITAAYIAADTVITDSLGTAALLDVGTGADEVVQLDGDGKLPALDGSALTDVGTPIGTIIMVAHSTPDTGYLECDGSAISRTTYAALFAKIGTTYGVGDTTTTFNIPDCRGEFIRGWDNSRGIDTGRVLGSNQSDDIKSHNHASGTLATASAGSHTHNIKEEGSAATGSIQGVSDSTHSNATIATEPAGAHTHTLSGSTASTGSSETRPRNISFMFQIRVI